MKQKIIVISGKKQAGKSSLAKYIMVEYLNYFHSATNKWTMTDDDNILVKDSGEILYDIDNSNSNASNVHAILYDIKIYGFADPLKKFCIDTLGLTYRQCYGTDKDKNSPTHIMWESLPKETRAEFCRKSKKLPAGPMTVREVLQVFGTNICRKMDPNCWARSTYNQINQDDMTLSIICDARFPNEITMGTEIGAKAVRLTRKLYDDSAESEIALDDFPQGEYSCIIDNQNITRDEKNALIKPSLVKWFEEMKH